MLNGQANGRSIIELAADLDKILATINDACQDNSTLFSSIINVALAGTPFEVRLRAEVHPSPAPPRTESPPDETPGAETSPAEAPRRPTEPAGGKFAKSMTANGKTARTKSLPQPIFEYEVLAILSRQTPPSLPKDELIARLPPKLNFGSPAAITTRLNNMRNDETDENPAFVDWNKGKQQAVIAITPAGERRLAELLGSDSKRLSQTTRQFLVDNDGWFGEPL